MDVFLYMIVNEVWSDYVHQPPPVGGPDPASMIKVRVVWWHDRRVLGPAHTVSYECHFFTCEYMQFDRTITLYPVLHLIITITGKLHNWDTGKYHVKINWSHMNSNSAELRWAEEVTPLAFRGDHPIISAMGKHPVPWSMKNMGVSINGGTQ